MVSEATRLRSPAHSSWPWCGGPLFRLCLRHLLRQALPDRVAGSPAAWRLLHSRPHSDVPVSRLAGAPAGERGSEGGTLCLALGFSPRPGAGSGGPSGGAVPLLPGVGFAFSHGLRLRSILAQSSRPRNFLREKTMRYTPNKFFQPSRSLLVNELILGKHLRARAGFQGNQPCAERRGEEVGSVVPG